MLIQLATETAYLAESAVQMAGCWHQWWDIERASHLLHDLNSIQPRPNPSPSKQLNVKAAKGIHINIWPPNVQRKAFFGSSFVVSPVWWQLWVAFIHLLASVDNVQQVVKHS